MGRCTFTHDPPEACRHATQEESEGQSIRLVSTCSRIQMELTFNQHLLQQHLQNHWTIAYWGAPTYEKIRNWAFAVSHCNWCFLSTSLVGTARTILSYIVWLRIEDYWLFQHPLQSANDILVHIMHAISFRPTSQRNLRTSSTAWRPHKKLAGNDVGESFLKFEAYNLDQPLNVLILAIPGKLQTNVSSTVNISCKVSSW